MLAKRGMKTATVLCVSLLTFPTAVPWAILRGSARGVRDVNHAEKVTPVTGSASLAALASSAGDANVLVVELTLTALLYVPLSNLIKIPWHRLELLRKDVLLATPKGSALDAGVALTVVITTIVTASAPCAAGASSVGMPTMILLSAKAATNKLLLREVSYALGGAGPPPLKLK